MALCLSLSRRQHGHLGRWPSQYHRRHQGGGGAGPAGSRLIRHWRGGMVSLLVTASTWAPRTMAGSISPTAPRWPRCGPCWIAPDIGVVAWCLSLSRRQHGHLGRWPGQYHRWRQGGRGAGPAGSCLIRHWCGGDALFPCPPSPLAGEGPGMRGHITGAKLAAV